VGGKYLAKCRETPVLCVVVMCCSVLQCGVAVWCCCVVLQCVGGKYLSRFRELRYCVLLQCVVMCCCSVLLPCAVAVCCCSLCAVSMWPNFEKLLHCVLLQCVVVCCSVVLQCGVAECGR